MKIESPLNGTQDNHFLQCVEFMTEQKFSMTFHKQYLNLSEVGKQLLILIT